MIVLTKRLSTLDNLQPNLNIYLTAEERQKTRQSIVGVNQSNHAVNLQLKLPRGIFLEEGDLLASENEEFLVKVWAKKEAVITITSPQKLNLIKAAYHLGNRHVPLEIKEDYVRLLRDPVLAKMLINLGLNIKEELTPFYPEIGAYSHHH